MKKVLFTIAALLLSLAADAQENLSDAQKAAADAADALQQAPEQAKQVEKPKYWKNSIAFDLGLSQTALCNWVSGGSNSFSVAAGIDAQACYAKGLDSWNNRLQLNYAMMWVQDNRTPFQKTNDRIYLQSTYGRSMSEKSKWKYSANFDFRTQFSPGYDYSKGEEIDGKWNPLKTSNIMSPGYINLALGAEWVPNEWFDLTLAPVTGSVTICTDPYLRSRYGMSESKAALLQLGAQMKANARFKINDKFSFETQLVMFYDYFFDYKNSYYCSAFPVRTNWDNKISWQIARFFKLGLDTWFIFDPLIDFADVQDPSAQHTPSHKIQFKEFFTINFTYTIASKNNK